MASIAFSVTMSDGTTMAKTAAVSDADVGRLLAAFAQRYRPEPVQIPAVLDGDGKVITPATTEPGVSDGPFLVGKWIEDTVVSAMNYVRGVESSAAAKQASDNVQLIPFTLA